MNENVTGDLEYLVNITKFSNVGNLVIGFDQNFGAPHSIIKFMGFKGEKLREKVKVIEAVYEVRANLADHKTPADKFSYTSNVGF